MRRLIMFAILILIITAIFFMQKYMCPNAEMEESISETHG